MTSGLDTRERNQQEERELAFGSALASVSETEIRLRLRCSAIAAAVQEEDADTDNFGERRFFEVRWVCKPNGLAVNVLSVHAVASPLTSLAAASFLG